MQKSAASAWRGNGDFLKLLEADREVSRLLPPDELAALFDLSHHTRHVDTIFRRVFGASG